MAEKLSKTRIYVSNITINGVLCKNPTVDFDETCFTVSCEGTDVQGRKYIEVAPLPDCDKQCIDVAVSCPNECDVDECSDVKRFCFCDDKTDCGECEECVNGFCEERCPDKVCVNDECVDCATDADCPCNLVCVNNNCQCPAGKKLNPQTGCCEDCITDSDCDICETCVNGDCQPKCDGPCKDGECVPCVNSGDCVGRPDNRACCGPDGCECCAGYCYDPVQKKCVICPPCIEDNDCPECHICVGDQCVPIVCPEGYICIGDECVKECDCDDPTCSRKEACIPYSGDTCICVECEGNCDEGCSVGCFCNPDTNQCEPNPCDKPCNGGADCGVGCGCDPDTNRCIPCDSLDCNTAECDRVDGCKCYGSTCIGDPCNGPCNDANDCGVGCGCDQDTNTCVSCDKLTCDECADVLGCECTNRVNCTPVEPCSGPCTTPSDCPEGCTCFEGECTPCAYFDCDDCPNGCDCNSGRCDKSDEPESCADTFTLQKNSDSGEPCDLVATLVTEECCSCPKIEVRSKLNSPTPATTLDLLGNTVAGKKLSYNVQLFKNGILLGNTGIINEKPTGGTFEVSATVNYRLTSGGVTTNGTLLNFATATGDISGLDTLNIPEISVPNLGNVVNTQTTVLDVTSVSITVKLTEDLTFPNECVYSAVETVGTYSDYIIGVVASKTLSSDQCRLPIFDWYRNATGSGFGSGNRFRRVYAERVNSTTYRDTLSDCTDGLFSGFFYRVTSDCTCANPPVEQALFCQDVLNFRYTIGECGTRLTVNNVDTPCDINGDLTAQGCTGIPSGAQVTWKLRITTTQGVEVNSDFVLPNANLTSGTIFDTAGQIILVEFIKSDDPSCKITEVETGGIDFSAVADCEDGGRVTVFLPNSGAYNVVITEGTTTLGSASSVNGTQDFTSLGYGKNLTVTVSEGTCISNTLAAIPTEETCCPTYTCSASYNGTVVNIGVSPLDTGLTYTYKVNGSAYVLGSSITLPNGTNTFTVTDSNGCGCSGTFEVDNCPNVTINANRSYDSATDSVTVSNITGGTAPYTVNIGGIIANNVPAGGTTINVNSLADGVYAVIITDADGCTGSFTIEVNRPDPCLDSNLGIAFTPASYDCGADQLLLTVSGGTAPYTFVVEDNGGPIGGVVDLGGGQYQVTGLADNTYTATATDNDGCVVSRNFTVDCGCNNPLIIDTISADCDGNDHVIEIANGISGGDQSPIFVTISSAAAGAGTVFYQMPVSPNTNITANIPAASALTAGQLYYIYAIDSTGKCVAQDSVQAPDCTASCEYDLGALSCSADGAQTFFTASPAVVGGSNNCAIIGGTVVVTATVNGSAANVSNVFYAGGDVVVVPNAGLMCPTQTVTDVEITLTINDLAPVFGGDGCECIDLLPIVINKSYTGGAVPDCDGSCP